MAGRCPIMRLLGTVFVRLTEDTHGGTRTIEVAIMKIVVIGGSGLIGSKLVTKLREQGHQAIAASPKSGVNSITGEGLAEALKGASVGVDVTNSPSWEDPAVVDLFQKSNPKQLTYERA